MKHIQMIMLFALLTLFASCNSPFETEKPALNGGEKIAHVQVNIGDNIRTILPDLDNGFSKYILSAEPTGSNTATAPLPVELTGISGYIYLPYGDWIITATAYITIAGADYAAAWGSASLTVENTNHSISLTVNAPKSGGIGIFNYTVRYPTSGTASLKLEPWPLGEAAVIEQTGASGNLNGNDSVPSGVYFLTVTVTANSRTIIRNDIVHIYDQSPTNVDYVFTKLDFGNTSLNISGTVTVLVNGVQPSQVSLGYSTDRNNWTNASFNYNGYNGNGTWSISLSNLNETSTLYFRAESNIFQTGSNARIIKGFYSIPIPVDDISDIDLGIVDLIIEPLNIDTWVNGEITMPHDADWYSINVTEGETYYIQLSNASNSGGIKTLPTHITAYNEDGGQLLSIPYANSTLVYTASYTGIVYLRIIAVYNQSDTGTYAIMYSDQRQSNVEVMVRMAFETNSKLYINYNDWVYPGDNFYAAIYDQMNYTHDPVLTYTWFIDGALQDVQVDIYSSWGWREATVYLPTSELSAGTHYGLVVVTIDGAAFAREFSFQVYK